MSEISPLSASPIGQLTTLTPPRAAESSAPGGASFGTIVAQAMKTLEAVQGTADAAAVDFVAGGPTELHDVMIAVEKANLGFQLTLQLRNKVVEAYQEIMRMQV